MTRRLERALEEQKQSTKQEVQQIPGILGMPLDGERRRVEVPDRNAFVYVRLRNNQSEVIQAYNNQVAPAYNLPVLVERQGNRYVVIGVDTQRYDNNWNSFAPYLPRHGNTHSFNLESGGGGDVVWVESRQFMPLLVFPSGSAGAPNVIVSPYTLKNDNGTWRYVGNTGTQSFANYRPTSATGAVMGLVYLSTTDGNPYILVNSGTVFSNSITGSSQIIPYIPSITNPSTQIPLAAIRLITGTSQISWDNIYDVRQFLHNTPTGTGGGSASIDTGTLNSLYLRLDATNDPVTGPLDIVTKNDSGQALTVENYTSSTVRGAAAFRGISGGWGLDSTAYNNTSQFINQAVTRGNEVSQSAIHGNRWADDSHPANGIFSPFIFVEDDPVDIKLYGGFAEHRVSGTTIYKANPQATGTVIPYIFNTQHPQPTGTVLSSWQVQGVEKARLDVSGTFYSNGQPLVKEAPVNGQSYVRKDAGWEQSSAGTSAVEVIYDLELTHTGTFSITSIPSTYRHIELRVYLRTNRASTFESVVVRFNNDSGANYDYLNRSANASSSSGGDAFAQTMAVAMFCAAASSASGLFSTGVWFANNYKGTVGHKKMQCRSEDEENNSTGNYWFYDYALRWASTSAINRIDIFGGSGGSFVAGSRVTVYGYK